MIASKKPSRIAAFIEKAIDQNPQRKSQKEIAEEMGYEKPNMLSMIKKGDAKLPLDKVPLLAKAVDVDPAFLFRLALEQYWPEEQGAIASIIGEVVSANERALIRKIRTWTKNTDPVLVTKENEDQLKEFFKA